MHKELELNEKKCNKQGIATLLENSRFEEFMEIKATKKAIGGLQSEEERYFEKHTLQLAENSEQLDNKKLITPH